MSPVRWPEGLAPEQSHVFAHNELRCELPPGRLWPWLIRATRWSERYTNCRRLRLPDGAVDLAPGMRFTWWTFGAPVTTEIVDFQPGRYLAWSGTGLGARGHHAWMLEPDGGGTRFITEETQRGLVVLGLRPLLRRGLLHYHQRWLEGLVAAARGGMP